MPTNICTVAAIRRVERSVFIFSFEGNLIGVASFGVKKKMSDLETLKEEVNIMDKEGEEKASEEPMSEDEKKKKEEELKRKKEEVSKTCLFL